ncbi:hypothetical protein GCM10009799_24280 [Nocardiopsis rhodophaea]|uniref:Glucokinase n=1 Tax=Nocardiopsis rhodophaea TaxID=280238 RepID=A0ABN2T1E1_9ACTN
MSRLAAPTPERPWLVADIGGTNARFGLIEAPGGRPVRVHRMPCGEHPDLAAAASAYLQRDGQNARPSAACVAIAGPMDGDRIRLTNANWDCSAEATRRALDLDRIEVLNDFAALALSLPRLGDDDLLPLGGPAPTAERPMAVLGPGTGLGVAGLRPVAGGWLPISGEGGHVDVPAVDERELEAVRLLRADQGTVTAECVLSGPGLTRLHGAVARMHGVRRDALSAADICASPDDPVCAETLDLFCALLGGFAGNVALTLGATGGVFIGGGVPPRISGILLCSDFRRRFEEKRRMIDYVKDIATVLIVAPTPALLGTAARLDQCLETR